ncbi:ABC transporter substrate-binding protein [Sodalis ligni]|uniref:Amino acid/amide ABC transporter substrate-binding protein (HAAT family) n=1 Tax=Sodalis ligni TaxID=2697027 RepID=A0A4R1NA92_9GAMM|nr:ABC transporter substrate-binding protein [Sodalis ligni]TCL03569.1 amino acid/amide ABC transporter substrate-binding protein (HAAT family) [Sodalis ligni]
MKKVWLHGGRAALLSLALVSGWAAAADKVVSIGYQAPLTGEYAQYGTLFRNSANQAVAEFNQSHRLPGVRVEVKFEDSKGDAKEGVNIARKFSDDQTIVGVIGDFSSTVSIAAGKVYAETHVPQLSQTASHPDFVKISPWQFRNITTMAYEGPYTANWVHDTGAKRAAIVAIQNDWGQSAAQEFAHGFTADGGQVVTTEFFNPGTRDFRAIITKIARQKPDVIYLAQFYEDGAAFLQQIRQLGVKAPLFGASSLDEQKLIQLAGPAAEGLRLPTSFDLNSQVPNVKHYVEQYRALYHTEPNQFAAQAYDATNILLDAIVKGGGAGATRQSVRDALAATKDFPGVTGITTFDPVTREPTKSQTRLVVQNGQFVPVASTKA